MLNIAQHITQLCNIIKNRHFVNITKRYISKNSVIPRPVAFSSFSEFLQLSGQRKIYSCVISQNFVASPTDLDNSDIN